MRYLLRLLLFLLRNLVLVMVVGALLMIAFTFAMDASNIYIIANDGMEMRTGVVLGVDNPVELTKFFTRPCLDSDMLLREDTYIDYTIRAFDHRADIEWLWTWPWDSTATVTLVQHVPVIDGELPISRQNEAQLATPGKILPPPWRDARYKLTFIKVEGQWKISQINSIEYIEALATRTPNYTPAPSATAGATATDGPQGNAPIPPNEDVSVEVID